MEARILHTIDDLKPYHFTDRYETGGHDNPINIKEEIWDIPKLLKAQAEISVKAGQDSRLKEVKEWMDKNCLGCRSNTPCNTDEYLGFHKESWQAFLKGLEGGKLNANRRSY